MAGESAREFARRQREKAERHARVAELYERGADGESATAAVLDALKPHGWLVFHDVRWPGRARANIDHVAVGPGGVFVIDSKHWSGRVTVADDVLRQNGRKREKYVVGVADAALAVSQVLGGMPVSGVLCFVREEPLAGWARGVMVCSTANIASMLASRPPTLHPNALARLRPQLEAELIAATAPPVPAAASAAAVATAAPAASGTPTRLPPRSDRPRRSNASTRKRPRRGLPKLALLIGIALVMLITGPALLRAVSNAVSGGVQSVLAPTSPVGTTVRIEGNSARPDLEVTAELIDTRSRGRATKPASGNRLVAVELRIKNTGEMRLDWPSGAPVTLVDTADKRHLMDLQRRKVTAGRLLPAKVVLDPNGVVEGFVVFELPVAAAVKEIDLTLTPGLPKTVRWRAAD